MAYVFVCFVLPDKSEVEDSFAEFFRRSEKTISIRILEGRVPDKIPISGCGVWKKWHCAAGGRCSNAIFTAAVDILRAQRKREAGIGHRISAAALYRAATRAAGSWRRVRQD